MAKGEFHAAVADYLFSTSGFSERLNFTGVSVYLNQLLFHVCLSLILASISILKIVFNNASSRVSTNYRYKCLISP